MKQNVTMEHNQHGLGYVILSISSAILTWTLKDAQTFVSMIAGLVAIVSGLFAIRYYIKATNKLK